MKLVLIKFFCKDDAVAVSKQPKSFDTERWDPRPCPLSPGYDGLTRNKASPLLSAFHMLPPDVLPGEPRPQGEAACGRPSVTPAQVADLSVTSPGGSALTHQTRFSSVPHRTQECSDTAVTQFGAGFPTATENRSKHRCCSQCHRNQTSLDPNSAQTS